MLLLVMLFEILVILEMFSASLAVVMSRALHVVLDQAPLASEIHLAVVANPVAARVPLVLPERVVARERSVASVTPHHSSGCAEREILPGI